VSDRSSIAAPSIGKFLKYNVNQGNTGGTAPANMLFLLGLRSQDCLIFSSMVI